MKWALIVTLNRGRLGFDGPTVVLFDDPGKAIEWAVKRIIDHAPAFRGYQPTDGWILDEFQNRLGPTEWFKVVEVIDTTDQGQLTKD